MTNSKTKTVVLNSMIAAIYVALTVLVQPVSQGPIQFRISESLNHLVVFNKKFRWGIVGGVIIFNFLFSEGGLMDVLFGGGQTLLALSLTILVAKYEPNVKKRLVWNIFFFTISMALIAGMLYLVADLPFWLTYGTTALSECIIMSLSAPLMYVLDKNIHFNKY